MSLHRGPNFDLMLGQRRRRWASIKAKLCQRLVFAGLQSRSRITDSRGELAVLDRL